LDLTKEDINIAGSATKGNLVGSGTTWTIDLAAVTAQGDIDVSLGKAGIETTTKTVPIYKGEYTLQDRSLSATDLKDLFNTEGVTATFNALHNLIASPHTGNNFADIIQLGDWIDLPSLHVEGYPLDDHAYDDYPYGYGKIDITYTTLAGHGANLRLIVVGINSFNNKNGNGATPHVVFQFQNVPGRHRIEADDTNQNGYLGSEMRTYLTNNFLTGLINAGVPDAVLWAPSRRVANKGGSEADVAADIIDDKLWLPTAWEMFGENKSSNPYYETQDNQASFAGFYNGNDARIKYRDDYSGYSGYTYLLASPDSSSTDCFCSVAPFGEAINFYSSSVEGVVPAFCVR
jgi:hypothetical protein